MDYYDDSEPSGEQGSAQGEMEHEADSGKTALVDSSLCPGMKPGEEFTVRVEKVLDSGEYQISYPGESEKEEPVAEESASQTSEMGSYME